jgi:hypothetical protein
MQVSFKMWVKFISHVQHPNLGLGFSYLIFKARFTMKMAQDSMINDNLKGTNGFTRWGGEVQTTHITIISIWGDFLDLKIGSSPSLVITLLL